MTAEVVTGLYRALVDELRRRGHPAGRPVKVSEIYDELIPYRAVRSALELDLNADYEHALLRLLSGEGDRLHVASTQARERLRREVEMPFPTGGVIRELADADVVVRVPDAEAEPEAEAEASADDGPRQEPAPGPEATRRERPAPRPAPRPDGSTERAPVRLYTGAESSAPAVSACTFCGDPLPQGRAVNFCPSCGADQSLRRCEHCEAVLERDWEYCISCGREVPGV